ncbi:hypothetical protein RN001_004538 [Aquatica leii]|uniref:E3 ubiquitin-protein ligase SHPRH n=1 Tax=Aquatica leii TaxID=1421715 RepID=A0AAN7SI32_9COLE|nr:hypothetical protein RN001_004538 [Aquatica leii]
MGRTKAVPIKISHDYIPIKKRNNAKSSKNSRLKNISYAVIPPNSTNEGNYLGEILLGSTNNVLPDQWDKCKVSFIDNESFFLKFEFDSSTYVVTKVTNDYKLIKGLFTSKIFSMKFHIKEDIIFLDLYILEFPLPKFNKTISNIVQMVFASIFDIEFNNEKMHIKELRNQVEEIDVLYKNVSTIRNKNLTLTQNYVQHPFLKPVLRPYQEQAVLWMHLREKQQEAPEMLHPLYQEITLKSGQTIYYNKCLGYIENEKPLVPSLRTGGILADEMGLGKTVEVLACILSYPMNETENHVADHSYVDESPNVDKQPRKRDRESSGILNDSYVDKPKKLKVPSDWVKSSSKKSNTRIALEMWYENTLVKLSTTDSQKHDTIQVQCICGDLGMDGSIMCVDCGKYQHVSCMGYKSNYGDYRCPKCWMQQPLLESKATLIVCPLSLRSQWCEEICKHVGTALKILVYEGSKAVPIYPTQLKNYDLVLTTYNCLQTELRLSEEGQTPTLRREPRYSSPGCPLILIKWWRLCLDEAQTVEIPTAMISTMAKKLHACHRWAVTGTPICRDILGLYGLIDYLQLEPYNELDTWNNRLYYPYLLGNKEPMYNFLAQIMWRSAKDDVISQINIPKQTVKEYTIEFSAVERYYYQREHELCTNFFLDKVKGYETDVALSSIDKRNLKKLMDPLLTIRQACNHPNATRGRYLATNKTVTSMEGLLDAIIEKNITDSEENLRIVVSALNGLAGIYLLLQKPQEAIEEYRKVLQLAARFDAEDNKKGVCVDKLQLIHTMYNLAEVIENHPPLHPTLRDDTLKQDYLNLQDKYMAKYITQNITTYNDTKLAINAVTTLQNKCSLEPGEWYTELFQWILKMDLSEDLYLRISTALENASKQDMNVRNVQKLLYLVGTWDKKLYDNRDSTIDLLDKMYVYDEEDDNSRFAINEGIVYEAMECHLRPEKEKKTKKNKTCLVCSISVQMRKYESVLFEMSKQSEDDNDISNKGSWKPSPQELVLKALYNLAKLKGADEELLKDGELFLRILESQKKEFKQMRKFWTYLDRQICAHDEINMCKIRLSLKDQNRENKTYVSRTDKILKNLSLVLENKLQYINFIEEHEMEYQVSVLKNEERQNMTSLERNLGIHKYLETLRLQQYAGQNPDPCPICHNALQEHWSILPCGHCYCLECIETILEKSHASRISCSVCRQLQRIEDVSYIRPGQIEKSSESIQIKGNFSTKIEAVVKLIIKLRNEDPDVKILIFSTWPAVLKIAKTALITNGISTELMVQTSIQQSLTKFKNNKITTLLLPIYLGSKGLNIIEATHVVLIEPLLNPGDELQAVGRIHRIGQTKETMVHKFIVKNTIEESLHYATSNNANSWDKNKVTLQQLKDLFINALNNENTTIDVDSENPIESTAETSITNTDTAENGLLIDTLDSETDVSHEVEIEDTETPDTNSVEPNNTSKIKRQNGGYGSQICSYQYTISKTHANAGSSRLLWFVTIIYLIWAWGIDKDTCENGGRRVEWKEFRGLN